MGNPAFLPSKPSPQELRQAIHRTVPDVISPGLRVLFCGINPGLYSGATGHHFARPGNRFWPALFLGGFTPRILHPSEKQELLKDGLGITNIVMRTTATAAELSDDELRAGAKQLVRKVKRHKPTVLAILGMGAYRTGFGMKDAKVGLQQHTIGETPVWILPNPSGLNAHYMAAKLGEEFAKLRQWVDRSR